MERTISEKTTSTDQGIEVTQKGTIVTVPSRVYSRGLLIPTNIEDVRLLTLTPMNATAALAFSWASGTDGGWFCDLKKVPASRIGASAFSSRANIIPLSEVGLRHVMSNDWKLYTAIASMSAASANGKQFTYTNLWRREIEFGSNATAYLNVRPCNSVSKHVNYHTFKFAYEVKGYNY